MPQNFIRCDRDQTVLLPPSLRVPDLDQEFRDQVSRLIRTRAPGRPPAAAIRDLVLDSVEGIRRVPADRWRGDPGYELMAAIEAILDDLDRWLALGKS